MPMSESPTIAYLVCATPRSGSTLLCETLRATGVAGLPLEHFEQLRHSGIPRQPREYFSGVDDPGVLELLAPLQPSQPPTEAPAAWWERILRDGSGPGGVWGGKLMWGHVTDLVARARGIDGLAGLDLASVLDALLPGVRLVHATREDKVAQAVSLWRAVQTQSWRAGSDADATAAVDYRFAGIDHLVRLLEAHDDAWRRWFRDSGRTPVTVVYEQLRAAPQAGVAELLRTLGLPAAEVPEPPLKRQRDDTSRAWAQRYREERAAAASSATAVAAQASAGARA